MLSCPAKPVSPYFLATTPAMRPQTARSTLYILKVLLTIFSFLMASAICRSTRAGKIHEVGYQQRKREDKDTEGKDL